MQPFLVMSVIVSLVMGGAPRFSQASSHVTKTCSSVLFVGDSLTYVNNLPELLSQIGKSKHSCIDASMVASGGESLRDHVQNRDVEHVLLRRHWQYVVFQDQSMFGEVYLVDGEYRVHDATELFDYGHRLAAIARSHGATPIVFLPWTARSTEARDTQFVRWAYLKFATDEHAMVVPVMDAWITARRQLPNVDLYLSDGLHPTVAGSYLAAALFFSAIEKESAVGATTTIWGPPVDFQTGSVSYSSKVLLAGLPKMVAKRLQQIAFEVTSRGVSRPTKPASIKLPRLPSGETMQMDALEGRWSGPLKLYPHVATITLEVCGQPAASIDATIDFGGRPDTIHFVDHRPTIGTKSLVFSDAHGPDGGRVRYRAVLEANSLVGIGEFLVPQVPVYGIGVWSTLRRSSATAC